MMLNQFYLLASTIWMCGVNFYTEHINDSYTYSYGEEAFTVPMDSYYFRKFPSKISWSLLIHHQFLGWVHNLYPSSLPVLFWIIQTAMGTGTQDTASCFLSLYLERCPPASVPRSTFLAPKDVLSPIKETITEAWRFILEIEQGWGAGKLPIFWNISFRCHSY